MRTDCLLKLNLHLPNYCEVPSKDRFFQLFNPKFPIPLDIYMYITTMLLSQRLGMHIMTQETIETVSAQDMLHLLDKFFSRYLDCSEEQRTVLRIWTLHTHCFAAAHATAYLNICSAEKQAGKSLCLQLLGLVCADPWLATAASPAIFTRHVTSQRPS